VSLKNLGIFLNKFCLHKNNNIRNIFIVLESGDKGSISVDKFRKINSWKGQELVSAF
jgi:Ca2+-binding EF-hand superfamily protein